MRLNSPSEKDNETYFPPLSQLNGEAKELKFLILLVLLSSYIKSIETNKLIAESIWEYLRTNFTQSISISHYLILSILSSKHSFKKYTDLKILKDIILRIYNDYSEANNDNFSIKQIYTSIFNVYNTFEEFIDKNLTKLDNMSNFILENGKVNWNLIMLNKRKYIPICRNSQNLKWLKLIGEISFINDMVNISIILKMIKEEEREETFKNFISYLNKENFPKNVYDPLELNECKSNDLLLKIDDFFSYTINTKDRVPLHFLFEYSSPSEFKASSSQLDLHMKKCIDAKEEKEEERYTIAIPLIRLKNDSILSNIRNWFSSNSTQEYNNINMENDFIFKERKIKRNSTIESIGVFGEYSFNGMSDKSLNDSKYKTSEKYSNRRVVSSIIKGNDELRQDFFVNQVVILFNSIWSSSAGSKKIKIHLQPYSIISNGSGGFIQTIENSANLSKINKLNFTSVITENSDWLNQSDFNACSNLKKYFYYKFGVNTIEYYRALDNFTASLAGYSLICYFLQIKDRNNGNILIDEKGNIIHIDFGFLFDKTPGNIKFEKSPFKFTNDFIDLLGGIGSNHYMKFQEFFFKGFMKIREKYSYVIGLCGIMCDLFNDLLSLKNKEDILEEMKEKFLLGEVEEHNILQRCNQLIGISIDNWSTKAYDDFQKYCVGI